MCQTVELPPLPAATGEVTRVIVTVLGDGEVVVQEFRTDGANVLYPEVTGTVGDAVSELAVRYANGDVRFEVRDLV